ncbi:MAG: hypothetical protein M3007_04815 [Candidatus Eremiobacteraeota bacterium]|nr:hypothetical protein [Candidatus Eremiobacteraeota bacterium]
MAVQRNAALRTVPLKLPEGLARQPTAKGPQLTYRGGPLLAAVEVFAIFWGPAWKQTTGDLIIAIKQFFDFVIASELIDQLAEYSNQAHSIGHGTNRGSIVLEQPAPPASVSDAAIRTLLQDQIKNAAVPQPTPNTLYFVYLPPGVTVEQGGSKSCKDFCGYHDAIGNSIFYGVVPYPDCSGCSSNLSINDALTVTTSHELCEAITDPVPGQGWYDDANGEIGDICAWQTKQLGSYVVQLEWSNKANSCV